MKKLTEKQRKVLCYVGLVIIFILLGNSNNNPTLFAERIFKPIRGDSWSIYYSGLIVIIPFYYILKEFNKNKERKLIKTRFRRIVVVIILILLLKIYGFIQ